MQQFVNQSPWPSLEVRASLARKVEKEFVPKPTGSLMRCLFQSKESTRWSGQAILWGFGEDGQLSGGGDLGFGDRGIEYALGLGVVSSGAMG